MTIKRPALKMRIKKAQVKNLFGEFDHVIDFKLQDRITIIHGANGLGKTAILKMINGFFNTRYSELRSTPFSEFRIDFDNDTTLIVSKGRSEPSEIGGGRADFGESRKDEDGPSEIIIIEYRVPGNPPAIYTVRNPVRPEEMGFPLRQIEEYFPGITRIGPDSWRLMPTGEIFTLEEIIETYSDYFPFHLIHGKDLQLFNTSQNTPDWLRDLKASLNVRLIETQRLVTMSRIGRRARSESSSSILTPAVARYSSELASLIQRTLTEYATLSQELDRSFPQRVVDAAEAAPTGEEPISGLGAQATPSIEQLRDRLGSLEDKRARLREAGVLDREANPYFNLVRIPPTVAETTKSVLSVVLSVYAEDVEKKLNVFSEVSKKIELLTQFVRDHFLNKELNIHKERGFILVSTETKKELSPTQLSSGEQHELVLMYELLFRVKPNSLILIDEPEISLHVDWQLQFLDDIMNIIKLSPFDVLIATHSPLIINQRWDLAVELVATK